MIDIHCHILPRGVDGPETIEESVALIRGAAGQGVRTMVATPHVLEATDWDGDRADADLATLRQACRSAGVTMEILLGAEIMLSPDTPDLLAKDRRLAINGRSYVLVELPMNEIPPYVETTVFQLLVHGFIPILAHPERYLELQQDPAKLVKLVQAGMLSQLNAGSLLGQYGRAARNAAREFLRQRCAHFLASDVHAGQSSPVSLSRGVAAAEAVIAEKSVRAMVTSMPECVIRGERIEPALLALGAQSLD